MYKYGNCILLWTCTFARTQIWAYMCISSLFPNRFDNWSYALQNLSYYQTESWLQNSKGRRLHSTIESSKAMVVGLCTERQTISVGIFYLLTWPTFCEYSFWARPYYLFQIMPSCINDVTATVCSVNTVCLTKFFLTVLNISSDITWPRSGTHPGTIHFRYPVICFTRSKC